MSDDESTSIHRDRSRSLAATMHELSCELVALRQEMHGFREVVGDLRDQMGDLRRQTTAKDEQVIILRTQHRVLWAIAAITGTSGIGALVLEILRVVKAP